MKSPAGTAFIGIGVNPTRIGGAERYARELSVQLAERNWRTVLCFLAAPAGPVREFLSLAGVEIMESPDLASPWIGSAHALWRALTQHRARIVHLQFTPFVGFLPRIARAHGASGVFFTDQTSYPEGTTAQAAPLWKRAAGRALTLPYTRIISISEFNRRVLAGAGLVNPARTVCVYNGTDVTREAAAGCGAAFRRRFAIPPERVLALQVSSLIDQKGIPDLLHAARLAVAREPALHFAVVGHGSKRETYERLAAELGIAGHVTWTGPIEDPFAEGAFAAADVLCQVSRWEEAFGFSIAEGMAFSKPVLATRVGGIPEVVRDTETGFLVSRRDPEAIAARLVELARSPDLCRRLGEAGRRRVRSEFDLRKTVRQVVELYGIGN